MNQQGGAYIMTLTVAMLLFTLVLSVLTITATSRRVTERYGYFFGIYDIAVAGNEQVFLVFQQAFENYREYAESVEAMMQYLQNTVPPSRSWGLTLDFNMVSEPQNIIIQDRFHGTTTVNPCWSTHTFTIRTYIYEYIGLHRISRVFVQSQIPVICLDYCTLEMVELLRVSS